MSILLAIIYLAFISLGIPDALLGSAWPIMHSDLGVPLSFAGIINMIIMFSTIIPSLMSDRLTKKFGTGLVTAFSVLITAAALFGFSKSTSIIQLCLCAVPYGLGAGAVDAALNNYVALHYSSRHMSWLHCFWGIGVTASPYIMSYCLTGGWGWNSGYLSVSAIQMVFTAILFISLPLWKKNSKKIISEENKVRTKTMSLKQRMKIKGVPFVLITFFAYCALEQTTGLWASSYLVEYRNIDTDIAARFASLFFIGITFGRFICGFIADKFGDRKMVRIGSLISLAGIILVLLPIKSDIFALGGLIIIGLGCAPVYPSIIHFTPATFGRENSQAIIGIQMASAYLGSTFMPPLFGFIASNTNIGLFPLYLLLLSLFVIFMSEKLNKATAKKQTAPIKK